MQGTNPAQILACPTQDVDFSLLKSTDDIIRPYNPTQFPRKHLHLTAPKRNFSHALAALFTLKKSSTSPYSKCGSNVLVQISYFAWACMTEV